MLGLKLNHVSKRGHWKYFKQLTWIKVNVVNTLLLMLYFGNAPHKYEYHAPVSDNTMISTELRVLDFRSPIRTLIDWSGKYYVNSKMEQWMEQGRLWKIECYLSGLVPEWVPKWNTKTSRSDQCPAKLKYQDSWVFHYWWHSEHSNQARVELNWIANAHAAAANPPYGHHFAEIVIWVCMKYVVQYIPGKCMITISTASFVWRKEVVH